MGHTLLVIEHSASSHLPAWLEGTHSPQFAIKSRMEWGKFALEQLNSCAEQVVVADAVPQTNEAIRTFQWLQENPISVPTFAIMPAEKPDLVRLAAATDDDFLIWPLRADEFRARLTRLVAASG